MEINGNVLFELPFQGDSLHREINFQRRNVLPTCLRRMTKCEFNLTILPSFLKVIVTIKVN
mgnify:CR=1 FL=1